MRCPLGYRWVGDAQLGRDSIQSAAHDREMQDAHPFAVHFREDNPLAIERIGVYEQALALTTLIDDLVESSQVRFHLKDLVDKSATVVAMRIAQAAGETSKAERRRQYRVARRAATDVAAVLDIMARRPGITQAVLGPAKQTVTQLVARLAVLSTK